MDNSNYRHCCKISANDTQAFSEFRRAHAILDGIDTVDPEYGQKYLLYIQLYYPELFNKISEFSQNDAVGSPLLVDYAQIGIFCPTTLRYIKTYGDLLSRFGPLKDKHIVEIGGGYGGFCRILASQVDFSKYTIVDLPETLELSRRYLETLGVKNVEYVEAGKVPDIYPCDIVISNYAFSECENSVQQNYLDKIIRHSEMGYMMYNFIGHVYDVRPFTAEEWREKLKESGFEVNSEAENPSPDTISNLLFTWKRAQ
jgi:putative sugar O-methyltransferase